MSAEYRIEYKIQRADGEDGEFVDIGFGSSGAWRDLDACTHMVDSVVTNYEWETEGTMPDPDEIRAAIDEATS